VGYVPLRVTPSEAPQNAEEVALGIGQPPVIILVATWHGPPAVCKSSFG